VVKVVSSVLMEVYVKEEAKKESELAFLTPPDPPPASKVVNTVIADVVIVGGGNSGFMAAAAAAEKGVSVAVIEKRTEDQYCIWTQDFGCINSQFAKSKGVPEYDPIEFMNEFMRNSLGRSNQELIRQYAYRSGETLDWVLEHTPDELKEGLYIYMGPPSADYVAAWPDGRIDSYKNWFGCVSFFSKFEKVNGVWNERRRVWNDVFHLIINYAKGLGAKWYCGLTGEQLIKTGDRITGVYAKDAGGNYTKFIANKGIILASGDFMDNDDMVAAYLPEINQAWRNGWGKPRHDIRMKMGPFTIPSFMGEGILMGLRAGGQMMLGPVGALSIMGGRLPFGGTFPMFNREGRRYCNEFKTSGQQAARQGPGLMCQICDSRWFDYLKLMPTDHGAGMDCNDVSAEYVRECVAKVVPGDPAGGHVPWNGGAEIGPEADKMWPKNVWCANTLSELIGLLGYQGEAKTTLLAEIEHYNDLCRAGKDTDFGKNPKLMWSIENPPYYGSVTDTTGRVARAMFGLGGLMTDGQQRVLDANGDPIPGLYATGNCAGDRYGAGDYYSATSGNYMGMACTLGRIVGQTVAEL
jgi:succinate dehydrogenase/fumarate reductase flavoprotein subunit